MRAVGNHGSIMACVPPDARCASAHQGREKQDRESRERENENKRTEKEKRKQAGEPRGETERTTPAGRPVRREAAEPTGKPARRRARREAAAPPGRQAERRGRDEKKASAGEPRDEGDKTKASGRAEGGDGTNDPGGVSEERKGRQRCQGSRRDAG